MFLTKSTSLQVKDIDEKGRIVTLYASAFNNKDLDGDIIIPGAFKKTIAERGPSGTKEIRHLEQHDRYKIIGRPIEMKEDTVGLLCRSYIMDTTLGNDALELYRNDVFQHSIGFATVKGEPDQDQEAYIIREVKLWEYSSVTWGANPLTPTVGIKSLQDYKDNILAILKKGKVSDEMFLALESQYKEITNLYNQVLSIRATEPDKSTQPGDDGKSLIELFRNELFKN